MISLPKLEEEMGKPYEDLTEEEQEQVVMDYIIVQTLPGLEFMDDEVDEIVELSPEFQRLIVASKIGRVDEFWTTSVDEIATFLTSEGRSLKKSMRFIVSTYHLLPKVAEALKKLSCTINFGIFDEAHVMEGDGKLYGMGLFDEKIPINKRLFATATARNYIGWCNDR